VALRIWGPPTSLHPVSHPTHKPATRVPSQELVHIVQDIQHIPEHHPGSTLHHHAGASCCLALKRPFSTRWVLWVQHCCCGGEYTSAVCTWGSCCAMLMGHVCVVCACLPRAGGEIHQGMMALAHKAVLLLLTHLPGILFACFKMALCGKNRTPLLHYLRQIAGSTKHFLFLLKLTGIPWLLHNTCLLSKAHFSGALVQVLELPGAFRILGRAAWWLWHLPDTQNTGLNDGSR